MKAKTIFFVPFITIIVMIVLNAVFHTVFAADFFDKAFAPFGSNVRPIRESNPLLLTIVESVWVITLFYLLTANKPPRVGVGHAIAGGVLINASVCGTWNLINASVFSVYPVEVILPDMAWHMFVIGPVAGGCICLLYNRFQKNI